MVSSIIASMRPRQATKNLLVFGALVFIPGAILAPEAIFRSLIAFLTFTFAASAGYIFNDLNDIQYDKNHPRKKFRPIASGKISSSTALVIGIFLLILTLLGSVYLDRNEFELGGVSEHLNVYPWAFSMVIAGYLLITMLYSLLLKKIPILDVLILSMGFVLRAVAGAVALRVIISPWLLLCTGLLALFLALGKRRQELVRIGENGENGYGRDSLSGYSIPLLDQLLLIAASVNIMSYSLYTFTSTAHPDNRLMLTIPFVIYGIFRYHYLIHNHSSGESPEEVLIADSPLKITVLTWIIAVVVLFLID